VNLTAEVEALLSKARHALEVVALGRAVHAELWRPQADLLLSFLLKAES
jgi:hypothetical protein